MSNDNLTCIACKHFRFETGCTGYSKYTPGYDTIIECTKAHWEVDMYLDSQDGYRMKLFSAKNCTDFEAYQAKL